jgi:hypothetical protein
MRYDPHNYQAFSFRANATPTLGLVQHATISFPFAYGWPLTVLGAVGCVHGLVHGLRRRDPMPAILGFFALFFWAAVVGRTTMNFARYSLPAHPVTAVMAAVTLLAVGRAALRVVPSPPRSGAHTLRYVAVTILGATALLSAEPAWRSIDYVRVLGLNDTRELARAWILEHAGEDAALETLGGYGRLYAVEGRLRDRCAALLPEAFRAPVLRLDFPADQSVQTNESRVSWRSTASAALYPVLFRGYPPVLRSPWVAVSRAYLPCGQETVRYDGTDPPPGCYVERARFGPGEVACGAQYDEQDHFYAPLWGHDGLVNLGPTVRVYENVCLAREGRSR